MPLLPKDGEHLETGNTVLWTAARCHRLLRQLQSRLASLRKLASEARDAHLRPPKRQSHSWSIEDEPERAPKRIRHTYRRRRQRSATAVSKSDASTHTTPPRVVRTLGTAKPGHSSPVSGHVDFSSPVWRNIRSQLLSSPHIDPRGQLSDRRVDAPTAVPHHIVGELCNLRSSIPERRYQTYEHILGWLSSLLMTTGPGPGKPQSKSLMAMCLRKMPACIQSIEAWDRQASRDDKGHSAWLSPDVSQNLYGQLEDFGSSGVGWRPLRLVVRAHAIAILSAAISEELLEPAFVGVLARLCAHMSCPAEAAKLASAIRGPLPAPNSMQSKLSESRKLRPLFAMTESMRSKSMTEYTFQSLSNLLRHGQLPVMWLSTRGLRGLWTSGLEALTAAKPKPSAINGMSVAINQLANGYENKQWTIGEGSAQTLVSIAAGVAAAALGLALDTRGDNGRAAVRRNRARRRLLYVLDQCVVAAGEAEGCSGSYSDELFVLAMARQLASVDSTTSGSRQDWNEELRELVAKDGICAQVQYRLTIQLMVAIARCRGRGSRLPSQAIVEDVCNRVDEMALPGWGDAELRADVAFSLAQKTKDLRDLAFAESLRLSTRMGDTAGFSTAFSGWRWEEGISEWVLPSPVAARRLNERVVAAEGAGAGAGTHEAAATDVRSFTVVDRGGGGGGGGVECRAGGLIANMKQGDMQTAEGRYASCVGGAAAQERDEAFAVAASSSGSLTRAASGSDSDVDGSCWSQGPQRVRLSRAKLGNRVGIRPGGSAGKSGAMGKERRRVRGSGLAVLSQAPVGRDDWKDDWNDCDELAMAIG